MARTALLAAAALVAVLALAGCAPAAEPPVAAPGEVLVVICPTLGWSDVTSGEMPVTRAIAERGTTGLVVSRTPGEAASRLEVLSGTGGTGDMAASVVAEGTPAEVDVRVADAVGKADPDASIVVVALPTATQAGFVVVAGAGYGPGLLTSASTRRRGIVTDGDLQATFAAMTGALPSERTQGVVAGVIQDDDAPKDRMAALVELETLLSAMERVRYPLLTAYTAIVAALVLVGWRLAETMRGRPSFGYTSLVVRRALLFFLALPAGGTLLHIIERTPSSPARIITQLLAATALVWLFAQFAWHKWGTGAAVALTGLVTAGVIAVDQLLGAPLSVSSLFSYSPLMALRFYGLGNEGAAVLVGAALTGIALELDAAKSTGPSVRRAAIVMGVLTVGIAVLPFFGANVVVALWGTLTFAVFAVRASGGRFGWRQGAWTLAIAALAVSAAVVLDRAFGSGTHIARSVGEATGGGLPALVLARLRTSLAIFGSSPLPAVVLAIVVGFAYLLARPRGVMAATLEAHPLLRAALAAGFAGGALGAVVEDSGLVILGLLLLYLAGALTMLLLEPEGERLQRKVLP
jgi:hypothetical protein